MTDEHQSLLGPGRIQFHQWCQPPLEPGDYTVTAEQRVAELEPAIAKFGDTGPDAEPFRFTVAGPRFSLSPSDVYSVYPPKGEIGDFANSLPHVVFSRRTLPWERTVTTLRSPWMALLVVTASDFEGGELPQVVPRKVGELIALPGGEAVGPRLAPPAYERDGLCATVDIPWKLFQEIAPSAADLQYLAHVREVDTGDKETASFLADGWFSVVLANRFPRPEVKGTEPPLAVENRALLVSLEGLEDFLPPSRASAGGRPVRLAVLSSWSFHCRAAFTFKAAMERLSVARIGVPWQEATPQSRPERRVGAALRRGYTALNHSTRLGEKAVSWYRGPLVPLSLTRQTSYAFRPAADAALRYDPIIGMMDVSYAGAFQLGRLLGLQDRHFAASLHAYRGGVRRQINEALGRRRLQAVLGQPASGGQGEAITAFLGKLGGPEGVAPKSGWAVPEPEIADPAAGAGARAGLRVAADFDLTVPGNVSRWLGRLMLLYRVPFAYLVPDERMLPPDSIRFFHLDPGWLNCLLEGACSVGRSSTRDELVDRELRDNFLDYAIEHSRQVRTRSPESGTAEPLGLRDLPQSGPTWPRLTGFLMRSSVVEGWQGLEMRAWGSGGVPLSPLRIDRLGPDVMICIFEGKVNRIDVTQPPEGMHFGAALDGSGGYVRHQLRSLVDKPGERIAAADPVDGSRTPIPLRGGGQRVVDVAGLARDLQAKLSRKRVLPPDGDFTSAHFAVEMVESPGRVTFDAAFRGDS